MRVYSLASCTAGESSLQAVPNPKCGPASVSLALARLDTKKEQPQTIVVLVQRFGFCVVVL